jgi:hypothetical protein
MRRGLSLALPSAKIPSLRAEDPPLAMAQGRVQRRLGYSDKHRTDRRFLRNPPGPCMGATYADLVRSS